MRFDLGSIFIRRLSYANIPPPLGIYKDNRLLKIIGKSILRRSLRCCNIIQIKTYMVRYITPDNYLLSFYGQLWRCGLYNRNVTNCFRVTCQLYQVFARTAKKLLELLPQRSCYLLCSLHFPDNFKQIPLKMTRLSYQGVSASPRNHLISEWLESCNNHTRSTK